MALCSRSRLRVWVSRLLFRLSIVPMSSRIAESLPSKTSSVSSKSSSFESATSIFFTTLGTAAAESRIACTFAASSAANSASNRSRIASTCTCLEESPEDCSYVFEQLQTCVKIIRAYL